MVRVFFFFRSKQAWDFKYIYACLWFLFVCSVVKAGCDPKWAFPSWGQAFPLGDLFWLLLRLVIRAHQVKRLVVEPLYCISLLLKIWKLLLWSSLFLGLHMWYQVLPSYFLHFVVAGTTVSLSTVPRLQQGWVGKKFRWLPFRTSNGVPRVC